MMRNVFLLAAGFLALSGPVHGQQKPDLIFIGGNNNGSVAVIKSSIQAIGMTTKRFITVNVPSEAMDGASQPITHIAVVMEADCSNNTMRSRHSQAYNVYSGDKIVEWDDDTLWVKAGKGTPAEDTIEFVCNGYTNYGPIPSIRQFVEATHKVRGR